MRLFPWKSNHSNGRILTLQGSINPGPQNPKYHTRWTPTELTVDSQVRWTSFEKRRIKTELKKVIEEIKRRGWTEQKEDRSLQVLLIWSQL